MLKITKEHIEIKDVTTKEIIGLVIVFIGKVTPIILEIVANKHLRIK